jgi:hypothetical protein
MDLGDAGYICGSRFPDRYGCHLHQPRSTGLGHPPVSVLQANNVLKLGR